MPTQSQIRTRLFLLSSLFIISTLVPGAQAQDVSSAGNLQFNYAFVALTNSGDSPQFAAVESNHTLRSGDKLKFYLEALSETYLYLFHLGPGGVLSRLFPESEKTAKIPLDQKVIIPGGNKWLELDTRTGKEKFYLIVSQIRQNRLESLYQNHLTLGLGDNNSINHSLNKILDEINKIRQENLSKSAERPVRIGGTFRGPASDESESSLDIINLASNVVTKGAYSRFFSIDHQ